MGRIESPETDQNILENLTKSGQSGLYKCYWLTNPLIYMESYIPTSHTQKRIDIWGDGGVNLLNEKNSFAIYVYSWCYTLDILHFICQLYFNKAKKGKISNVNSKCF